MSEYFTDICHARIQNPASFFLARDRLYGKDEAAFISPVFWWTCRTFLVSVITKETVSSLIHSWLCILAIALSEYVSKNEITEPTSLVIQEATL